MVRTILFVSGMIILFVSGMIKGSSLPNEAIVSTRAETAFSKQVLSCPYRPPPVLHTVLDMRGLWRNLSEWVRR
jgi:hypothetical protein